MNAGRPTKYGNELQIAANSYVEECCKGSSVPFVEELALLLDVNDDTIVEWAKIHDEFSATLKRLKLLQRLRLKQGSLEKKLQANIAMFLLQANHSESESTVAKIQVVHVSPLDKCLNCIDKKTANSV